MENMMGNFNVENGMVMEYCILLKATLDMLGNGKKVIVTGMVYNIKCQMEMYITWANIKTAKNKVMECISMKIIINMWANGKMI
jgi:hypothetical protein